MLIKSDLKEVFSTLNDEQAELTRKLLDFINSESEYFLVNGFAGTGKTYTISRVVSALEGASIAMTAPTNKAVKVLERNKIVPDITCATIHKLLALKLTWVTPDKHTESPYQQLSRIDGIEPDINTYDLVIIDESSMLDENLLSLIDEIKDKSLKIIFLGDPAQIPPVNCIESAIFTEEIIEQYQIERGELTTIVRQKNGNKIIDTAYEIRCNRFEDGDPIINRTSNDNVKFLHTKRDNAIFYTEMLGDFTSQEFKDSSDHCKVIAWTNRTVSAVNTFIRKGIYGKDTGIINLGERLIADKPILDDSNKIIFNTSDEFEVVTYSPAVYKYVSNHDTLFGKDIIEVPYYRCIVSTGKDECSVEIRVLMPDGEKAYALMMKKMLESCRKTKRWKEYYKMIGHFARVKYNYAITAHKSQGSTYTNVYIIEDDIDGNSRFLERNRIKYTACTRPRNKLFILGSRNG